MPFVKGQPGGPGRPRKADKYAGAVVRAENLIVDRLPQLIANMLVLANGVLVEEVNPVTGKLQVYQRPPDRQANEYLINRVMGKPIERQEIGGIDGGAIGVHFVDYRAGIPGTAAGSDEDSDPSGEG